MRSEEDDRIIRTLEGQDRLERSDRLAAQTLYRTERLMIAAEQIISLLHLKPHPEEGGYFTETYRSSESIPMHALPGRYEKDRSFATAIYYLLTPDTFSAMHQLLSDEIFHFYAGDPLEMLQLWPDGSGRVVTLGADLVNGMRPQVVVPAGVWMGARLRPGGRFALLGTTVSPGFDFADYRTGQRKALTNAYPRFKEMIISLTKEDPQP